MQVFLQRWNKFIFGFVNGFQNRFGVAEVIIVYGFVRELVKDFFGCTG